MSVDVADLRLPPPPPRRRGPGPLGMVVTAALGAAAMWGGLRVLEANGRPAGASPPGARLVRTIVCTPPPAGGTLAAAGWLEPAPPWPVVVSARGPGTVIELPLLPGDPAPAGTVVARLDPEPARLARDRAAAVVGVAAARLATLKAGSRPEELAIAEAAVREAEAERVRAAAAAMRASGLVGAGGVSAADAERAVADLARADAVVAGAAARRDLVRAGPRPETIAEANAEVARERAVLAAAEAAVGWTTLTTPVAGTVLDRHVAVGEAVAPTSEGGGGRSAAICSLYDPSALQVRADLPQAEASRVVVGQAARVTLESAPGRSWTGRVARLDPLGDLAKNTVRARVALTLAAPDPALRPDLTARVVFAEGGEGTAAALRVASRCVRRDPEGPVVFVVAADRVRRTAVTLGEAGATDVEVRTGLSGGERLVLDPPGDLADGETVAVDGSGRG